MPELPEVETIARGVAVSVRGERVESVWLSGRKQTLNSPPRAIARTLEGARIDDVHRVGKHIVFELSRGGDVPPPKKEQSAPHPQFIVHLGMTGSLTVVPADKETAKHTHAVLKLSSGRELRFVDPRMFGKLAIAKDRFRAPGHEPLDVGAEAFAALFKRTKAPIKSALLNQKLLSGVGNIYADEALFRARVRPRRRGTTLTHAELHKLFEALQAVLNESIKAGGTTFSDYVDAQGEWGNYQFDLRVYGREDEPCVRCKTPIKRIVISGRSAHYCRKCQS
ncbi:MAG: bifunctional DNA-formamidopyrimidine glycosylase/DNA-(apurinic or apyrimidinic site) lyase [Candidatus Koribacter versatilis]|uniref:Formamidopyrimidine-DNA glycosylase n=1 Tax=Candidatus Korobacter versatilis TaxID=658062 RepID=A0A932EQL5_9BACT|nr:bifunctional DNA-formamidopyrimidine glycosylase/DNA-(apurinic or apyrimidinic site) lyase [Candidatus Koribacter versatilis]